ncbi:MAG: flagellar basal body rod protein FlgB [Pseudomonadota bacterium]
MKTNLFGHHEHALRLSARRNEVLATNIANADTPNYLARDIDFAQSLRSALGAGGPEVRLRTTAAGHVGNDASGADAVERLYRVPTQPSLDGNTVETDVEQAEFAENVIQYRAGLMFVNGRIRSMRLALTGQR